MLKRTLGISFKINFLFLICMIFVILAVGTPFYYMYSGYMMRSVVTTLTNSVQATETLIDPGIVDQLVSDSNQTPEYLVVWKKIKHLEKSFGLHYLYLMRPEAGKFRLLYDTLDDPEVKVTKNSKGTLDFSYYEWVNEKRKKEPWGQTQEDDYYTIYDDAPKEVELAYEQKKLQETAPYTDKWGTFKSVYMPIFKDGKVAGIIGADYDISFVIDLERKALLLFAVAFVLGFAVTILTGLAVRKVVINPILVLSGGSEQLASGNLEHRIQIPQKDEIGALADSFNAMASSLKDTFQQIKDYNEKLEDKVTQRTHELNETLVNVQRLKSQQDGDYFLTTLLMDPLMMNRSKSDIIKVEFFMKQKKEFQFRNKYHALGGDICISGDLLLNGRTYVMFFNGDAMGKSIQGAGGALVMGSMINSIMARSAANKNNLNQSPDLWLLDCFKEVQRVMEAFDGSMLVSCIMGLVDTLTAQMFYFNAEHPFTILYRDDTAHFIEDRITAHKFGMPGNKVEILHIQLKENDIVLCGSDGKDDVKYHLDDGSLSDVINEDETKILRIIEEQKANLPDIYSYLKDNGQIIDDYSFLKLSVLKITNEIFVHGENPKPFHKMITELVQTGKFSEALTVLEDIDDDNDLTVVFYKAVCLNKLQRNNKALEILLNATNKIKNHKKVLKLFSRIYLEQEDYVQAKYYTQQLLALDPTSVEVKALLDKINVYL